MTYSSRKRPYLRNFELPLNDLEVGDFVKVNDGQSFWVQITKIHVWLYGIIHDEIEENEDGNQKGDLIKMNRCNVLDVRKNVNELD